MKRWLVEVDTKHFIADLAALFELGRYRWRWLAVMRAWIYVTIHPLAAAWIRPIPEKYAKAQLLKSRKKKS